MGLLRVRRVAYLPIDHRRSVSSTRTRQLLLECSLLASSVLLNRSETVCFLFFSTIRLHLDRDCPVVVISSFCCRDRALLLLLSRYSFLSLRFTTFTRDYHCESQEKQVITNVASAEHSRTRLAPRDSVCTIPT